MLIHGWISLCQGVQSLLLRTNHPKPCPLAFFHHQSLGLLAFRAVFRRFRQEPGFPPSTTRVIHSMDFWLLDRFRMRRGPLQWIPSAPHLTDPPTPRKQRKLLRQGAGRGQRRTRSRTCTWPGTNWRCPKTPKTAPLSFQLPVSRQAGGRSVALPRAGSIGLDSIGLSAVTVVSKPEPNDPVCVRRVRFRVLFFFLRRAVKTAYIIL